MTKKNELLRTRYRQYIEEQLELALKVRIKPLKRKVRYVAGVDASFPGNYVRAAAVVIDVATFETVDEAVGELPVEHPYVPTLLYLREGPALLKALLSLRRTPDVVLVDGQGILHPRRFGEACYIGVHSGMPVAGVAKSRLAGRHRPVKLKKGLWEPVYVEGELRGAVLCTRDNVKPVYVSPGHLMDLNDALNITLQATGSYRIPEPLRRAHKLAGSSGSSRTGCG